MVLKVCLFSDEADVEGDEEEHEMKQRTRPQKLGRYCCEPEEWDRDGDVKPIKIPVGARRYKKSAREKLEHTPPVNSHPSPPALQPPSHYHQSARGAHRRLRPSR